MKRNLWWTLIGVSMVLSGVATGPMSVAAGPKALPPRPTPAPTATLVPQVNSATGSAIQLHADTMLTNLWTGVEWQDAAGNWHPVEGWQGTLESDHTKTWWVAPADRGKGPFRWMVYLKPGGQLWGSSQPFYLPSANRQTVSVKVTAAR